MTSPLTPTKILCVGQNYRAHIEEMGHDVPSEPLLFLKPPSSLNRAGEPIVLPPGAGRVDYEGEIAFVIGRRARAVDEGEALSYVGGVVPANDVTARELQRKDSQWTRAKGFDTFCPVGEPVSFGDVQWDELVVRSRVNGELRQEGRASDFVFPLPFLIAFASRIMTLEPGDLLLTGTPAGVGPLAAGDEVEVEIPGVGTLRNPVRGAPA